MGERALGAQTDLTDSYPRSKQTSETCLMQLLGSPCSVHAGNESWVQYIISAVCASDDFLKDDFLKIPREIPVPFLNKSREKYPTISISARRFLFDVRRSSGFVTSPLRHSLRFVPGITSILNFSSFTSLARTSFSFLGKAHTVTYHLHTFIEKEKQKRLETRRPHYAI